MAINYPDQFNDKKVMNSPLLHGALPVMRAKVVNIHDRKKIGRVQLRIPSYHGVPGVTDKYIEDAQLPWATPCFYGGCGQDWGSFMVPIPGSWVWVLFEDNDVEKPVYIGGIPSRGSSLAKEMNDLKVDITPQQPWTTVPGQPDIPFDEFEGKTWGVPERGIIFKSQKGHTIMFDDTDGKESMTFMDRVGQVIKFFAPVKQSKNFLKYHRELHSAEKNDQLGAEDGLAEESSIMIKSGELGDQEDPDQKHSLWRMWHSKMRAESIDAKNDKFTTTDYDPYEYNQQTQKSILNMTEDHIFFDFKDALIHEHFCDDYWRLTAFKKCVIECTEDHMLFQYEGNGLYIDADGLHLKFKGTILKEDDSSLTISASDLYSVIAGGSTYTANDSGLSGKGKEIKFEGSGSIETSGGKTYLKGTEIHFDK